MVFDQDIILPIKHVVDWRYIRQCMQEKLEKDVIHENSTRINYNYMVGYQVMLSNKSVYNTKLYLKALTLKLVAFLVYRCPERAHNLVRLRDHFIYRHWKSKIAILQ